MKHLLALAAVFGAHAAMHADAVPKEQSTTPFIEYHNRMAVFSINHLVYERIKTDAFYAGVEGWAVNTFDLFSNSHFVAEGEVRFGYNFFWNGRDHFTPIVGGGFFKDFEKRHEHGHRYMRPGICYATLGFLYDHEFTSVFNLGLNVKGICGGAVSKRHSNWGNPVLGVDVSLPITFRFGHKRHWDARLEPFDIYLHSHHYIGGRSTVGYRF